MSENECLVPPSTAPLTIYVAVNDNSLVLDIAGPAEAVRIVNDIVQAAGQPPVFDLQFIGDPSAKLSVGLTVNPSEPYPDNLAQPCWIMIPGQSGLQPIDPETDHNQRLINWLRQQTICPGVCELITVCAGSVLAAYAGLLKNRQATTHYHNLSELAEVETTCEVLANRVFVDDNGITSSAGVSTGIDLMIYKIEQHCSAAMAAQVANWLVMPLRRTTHDPQASPFLAHRNHLHPALHSVQNAIAENPQQTWTIGDMASLVHLSTRHLNRLFIEHTGISPKVYLRDIRLSVAQSALRAGHKVGAAAELAGFSSDTQLRRAWATLSLSISPSEYAQHHLRDRNGKSL